jgi:hypothetical protein
VGEDMGSKEMDRCPLTVKLPILLLDEEDQSSER